jgi:secondary thiamine-phosphate synthase enzyme
MSAKAVSGAHKLKIRTSRRTELKNVTEDIEKIVAASGCAGGVCHLYVPHTTAGVMVNEGYDPDVARDMEVTFDRLIPHKGDYRHAEGNSDSHIKTALIGTSETIWIEGGRLAWAAGRQSSSRNSTGRARASCMLKSFLILRNSPAGPRSRYNSC